MEYPVNDERMPPHSLEAEQAVLGSVLLEPEAMETAAELLRETDFFLEKNRFIYGAMLDSFDEGEPVDLVTVTRRLIDSNKLDAIGGQGYLFSLQDGHPTAANLPYYANIVKQKQIHRQAIKEIQSQLRDAWEAEDPGKLLNRMQAGVESLSEQHVPKKDFRQAKDIALEFFGNLEKATYAKEHGKITGLASGYGDLDRMTSGFQKSDLIIVAARPSVGKTAFSLNVALNIAMLLKEAVAVFSLEMGDTQLMQRMVGCWANIDQNRMRTGDLQGDDWEKVTMAIGAISESPIYIDDSGTITVSEIRSKCRRLQKEKGLGLILIDYLQLIQGRGKKSRQEEVADISRSLKQLARELDVPIIALSQLSRSVEQRQDKRPMMSDLRDSGSIEQDADIVAFLYRDDYYDKESEKKNIIEIIIAKQRNGAVGTVELAFLKQFGKFVPLDRSHQEAAAARPSPPKDMGKRQYA
ncbi:replicative DNA helicase [Gorillibacterium sp. sgz5001074]|uniref:replicative DNA helicase n=1 Tax=Gorillibacterium sp. sgz5001074 TaxID=3446695 RepID=UPI003F678DD4